MKALVVLAFIYHGTNVSAQTKAVDDKFEAEVEAEIQEDRKEEHDTVSYHEESSEKHTLHLHAGAGAVMEGHDKGIQAKLSLSKPLGKGEIYGGIGVTMDHSAESSPLFFYGGYKSENLHADLKLTPESQGLHLDVEMKNLILNARIEVKDMHLHTVEIGAGIRF